MQLPIGLKGGVLLFRCHECIFENQIGLLETFFDVTILLRTIVRKKILDPWITPYQSP